MSAKQTLNIMIVNCGGMVDQMSEGEAQFLSASLGMFRNVQGMGRATPRAAPTLIRAYRPSDVIRAFKSSEPMGVDILHLIAQGASSPTRGAGFQVGVKSLHTPYLERMSASGANFKLPEVVISTICSFDDARWHSTLKKLGVRVVISSDSKISPANLTAFNMAFYSALLSRVYKSRTTLERVESSFNLAARYYGDIHAVGSPRAQFNLAHL